MDASVSGHTAGATLDPTTPASNCICVQQEPTRVVVDPDGNLSLLVGKAECIHSDRDWQAGSHASGPGTGEESSQDGSDDVDESVGDDPLLTPTESDDGDNNGSSQKCKLPVLFIVCSKTVARACRAWKTLLYGGFAESRPACHSNNPSDWLVKLPDDDPEPMETILNIIHSRFELLQFPSAPIAMEKLYRLTILVDKYDLTRVLRLWAPDWLKQLRSSIEDESTLKLQRASWIAWVLGDEPILSDAFADMVLGCTAYTSAGSHETDVSSLFKHIMEPPGLKEQIISTRQETIERLLAIFDTAILKGLQAPENGRKPFHCSGSRQCTLQNCTPEIIGIMITSLYQKGYWPLPEASLVGVSIEKLSRVLGIVIIKNGLGCTAMPDRYKKICWIVSNVHVPYTSAQVEYIGKQAAKLSMEPRN